MKEELKRELEELKEPSPERTEELLKDLKADPEPESLRPRAVKKDYRFFLIVFGIVASLLGLVSGGFFLWKLLGTSKQSLSGEEKNVERFAEVREERNQQEIQEISRAESEKIEFLRQSAIPEQAMRLKLPDFLLPLDDRNFVKIDVYLVYLERERYLEAQRREFELRTFFYTELKKVRGEFFRSEAKMKELEENLTKVLRTKHPQFSPDRIEFEGLILKT